MALISPLNPLWIARALERAGQRALRHIRPDHDTLARRRTRFEPQTMSRFYVYAAAAPSRATRRTWSGDHIGHAVAVMARVADGDWARAPVTSELDRLRFADRGADGIVDRMVELSPNGLIEMLWSIAPVEEGESRLLDLVEIASVVQRFAHATARPEYTALCCERRHGSPVRRLDWVLGLSTATTSADGRITWDALRFPGEVPARAKDQPAGSPIGGYGATALRSTRRADAAADVPAVLVHELLLANGYYEFEAARAAVLSAIHTSRVV